MLSRPGTSEGNERLLDVRWTLDASLELARALVESRARIVTEYEEAPLIRANDGRLSQVFLNLLLNAAQSIEPGHPESNEIRIRCRGDRDRVIVSISDTGCGIPRENRALIFNPFFTTKSPQEGTGLGLAICESIVKGLGGKITMEENPAGGATFHVEIPAKEPSPQR
jgi:signal transduction histidine kinase